MQLRFRALRIGGRSGLFSFCSSCAKREKSAPSSFAMTLERDETLIVHFLLDCRRAFLKFSQIDDNPYDMKKFASLALDLLAFPAVASAQFAESRKMWDGEMKKRCADHHVDWVGDGAYPAVIDAYDAKLPRHLRRKVQEIADYSHRCSNEAAGYSCEWAAHIDAAWKLKILPKFAAWACYNIKCKEPGFCKIPLK